MVEQDNVKIVQDAYAAFGRGDIPAVVKAFADQVEWHIPGAANVPVAGTIHGRQKVTDWFRQLGEHQTPRQFEPREFIAQGDKVAVLGHYQWLIKRTGRTFESDWVHVFTFRDRAVVRFQEFADTAASSQAYGSA